MLFKFHKPPPCAPWKPRSPWLCKVVCVGFLLHLVWVLGVLGPRVLSIVGKGSSLSIYLSFAIFFLF